MAELLTRKQIEEVVVQITRENLGIEDSISDQEILEGSWAETFGADSLDIVELVMVLEEELGISIPDSMLEIRKISQFIDQVEELIGGQQPVDE